MQEDEAGKSTIDIQRFSTTGRIRNFMAGFPRGHVMAAEVSKALTSITSLDNAEDLMVEQIRRAAEYDPSLKANRHVLTRRLSDKFRPVWHDPGN